MLLEGATLLAGDQPILSQLKSLKLRSTLITTLSLGKILALCYRTLSRLDISHTAVNSLDPLTTLLFSRSSDPTAPPNPWTLAKLNVSSLRLSTATLLNLFRPLSRLPLSSRLVFDTLYMNSMPVVSTGFPGLNDNNFSKILDCLEGIEGIERLGLSGNPSLGIAVEPMRRFFGGLGRRCRVSRRDEIHSIVLIVGLRRTGTQSITTDQAASSGRTLRPISSPTPRHRLRSTNHQNRHSHPLERITRFERLSRPLDSHRTAITPPCRYEDRNARTEANHVRPLPSSIFHPAHFGRGSRDHPAVRIEIPRGGTGRSENDDGMSKAGGIEFNGMQRGSCWT